ncbi:MAG: DEAD/DEAH box helicase [Litorilinea sp.]
MTLANLLADLRADDRFMNSVAAWRTQPPCPPRYGPLPEQLHPTLTAALAARGIAQLYTHQAACVAGALAGRNMAVVTPTASGKTLCYNLPVLHALLGEDAARALYLFPTKALAHDQLNELHTWQAVLAGAPTGVGHGAVSPLTVAAYDGDTPSSRRGAIRQSSRLLLTNPDMLHMGILPNHIQWETFLSGLRYVVIDEMHVYRGVFGSHVANVLRRLRRVCAFYGSRPQFICASATIANPQELAEQLVEAPVEIIDETGAPQGEKHIILYNPPIFDEERGLRRSSTLEAQELAARCVLGGQQTIVFGRARLTTELLLGYLRDRLRREWDNRQWDGTVNQAIRGYRGGYLPQERRAIEAGLRSGAVRAVVATNALELGIDIGQLQAAVLCGYPGTIAATWQQMGRAGRTTEAALAILVATGGALDQYVIRNPRFIFERSPEHALINPDNLMLLVDQMRCAAFELPFGAGERFGNSDYANAVLALLTEQGELHAQGGRYFWGGLSHPARNISLRTAGSDTVAIQVEGSAAGEFDDPSADAAARPNVSPNVIGELERAAAVNLLHDGAIYWHEGRSFVVEHLDLETNLAQVRPLETDYYTQVMSDADIEILGCHEQRTVDGAMAAHGELRVSNQILGYRRVKRFTHETLGVFPLDYPPAIVETTGYWVQVTAQAQAALEADGQWFDSLNDYGPNWAEQRAKVRARDGYRCSQCGTPEGSSRQNTGRQHDVHHLRPFRTFGYVPGRNTAYLEANQLSNLVLVCRVCHQRLESGVRVRTGLDGVAYALNNLAPLYLMCDPQDLGVHVTRGNAAARRSDLSGKDSSDTDRAYATDEDVTWGADAPNGAGQSRVAQNGVIPTGNGQMDPPAPAARMLDTASDTASHAMPVLPAIYLYERIAAGLGFSARLYELHADLVQAAQELIRACSCPSGCPACVGPVLDDAPVALETKQLALALLAALGRG